MRSESDRNSCNFDGCMDKKIDSERPDGNPCDLAAGGDGDTTDIIGGQSETIAIGKKAAGEAFWYHRVSQRFKNAAAVDAGAIHC